MKRSLLAGCIAVGGIAALAVLGGALPPGVVRGASASVSDAAPPGSERPDGASTTDAPAGVVRGAVTIDAPGALIPPKLSRVVAYLDYHPRLGPSVEEAVRAGMEAPPPAEARPRIAQINKSFSPDFLVVPVGTYVEFPNWDNFSHNVFSRSAAAPPFDLDRYPYGESKCYQFSALGVVQVFCNIHPSMRATIVVTPNDYFAVTDAEGRFAIEGVPDGTYDLVVWQARCHEHRQTIEIAAGRAAPVSVTLRQDVNAVLTEKRRQREPEGVMRGLGSKKEQLNLPVVKESHPACGHPPEGETAEDREDDEEDHGEPPL